MSDAAKNGTDADTIQKITAQLAPDRIAAFGQTLWTDLIMVPANWIQVILIALALFVGWFVRRCTIDRLKDWIDHTQIHFRIRTAMKNILRLKMYAIAAIILGVALKVQESNFPDIDMRLASATISILLALIVIRITAQVIQNSFTRQIVSSFALLVAAMSILGLLDDTTAAMDALAVSIGEFRLSALTLVKGLIALFILLYLALFVSTLVERRLNRVSGLTSSARVLLGKVTRVVLVTIAILVGVTTAGVDLSLLTVFGGALGLGIGFGLQKGISNLFSGMLLLMDKSIKPGDIIELPTQTGEGAFGWVQHMGARYTEIITRDNKSFLIPNEDFITHQVVNWSHGDTLIRLEAEFGVHYDSDPHEVKRLAEEAANKPSRVVDDPPPVCHLVEFGSSSLNFKLRFWIRDAHKGVTNMKGAVMLSLWDAFKENDIKIPYPHREVYLHKE